MEKIFDICCALVDVMSCIPIVSKHDKPGPQECLKQLIVLLRELPGGETRYLPLLMTKIADSMPILMDSALVTFPANPLIGFANDIKPESMSMLAGPSP